jgi:AcrR family transcriptional regulator
LSDVDVSGTVVKTPWGDAAGLRSRRLHPSSGTPRTEVIANQRQRLFGAIFAVVSTKGFEASTVADVIELSGVSRSAFYEHFTNKAECLAAAAAELIEPTIAELAAIGDGQAALVRFLELLDGQPAAARVCFVELRAAGEVGETVAERGMAALSGLAGEIAKGGDQGPDPELSPVLVAGMHKLIQTRLCRGEELAGIAPELWRWLASVGPPPRPLASRRGRLEVGPRFQGYTPAERIARAVASVVSERGYLEMSTDDIAAEAAISLSTFYAHFSDKRDAVLASLEMSGAQLIALAGPAARRAGDWQQGVRALYEAICAYFAAEPELAQLASVGIYGAGPQALARRDRVIDTLAAMLAPGFEENPAAPALSADAAAAVAYALIAERVRSAGPQSLAAVVPLATYITLVGFVGPERAVAVANAEAGGR